MWLGQQDDKEDWCHCTGWTPKCLQVQDSIQGHSDLDIWWKREHPTPPLTALYPPLSAFGQATLNLLSSSYHRNPNVWRKQGENYWLQCKGFPALTGSSESRSIKRPCRWQSCRESSMAQPKPAQSSPAVPAEAPTFPGPLPSLGWVDAEEPPLDKPTIEPLFRHAYRVSYFHRKLPS